MAPAPNNKRPKPPHVLTAGTYDSTYAGMNDPTQWAYLGNPTFTATAKLGDNDAGGVAELVLNGASQQLAWGVDATGHVNSSGTYPTGAHTELYIPQSSSPQTPSTFQVGTSSQIQYTGNSYGIITYVLVQALVNIPTVPGSGYVSVTWTGLTVTFTDVDGNVTTNSLSTINPVAQLGQSYNKGKPKKEYPWVLRTGAVLVTPSAAFNGGALQVDVVGSVALLSTDDYYKNYGANLSSTSMQAKILVFTD